MNATVLLCCCRWLLVTVLLRAVIPNVQLQEILPLVCINLSGHVIINAVEKNLHKNFSLDLSASLSNIHTPMDAKSNFGSGLLAKD